MGRGNMKSAIVAMSAILTFVSIQSSASEKVIYGKDNRKDLFEVLNPMHLKLANSTVALVKRSSTTQTSSGLIHIEAETFEQSMGVCKKERFSDQPSGGFCSGSLIGKNLILTAGHCITSMSDCQSTSFVFGYSVNSRGVYPSDIPELDVVSCKNIIYRTQQSQGADFAIVEIDREINHREPLKLANRTEDNELQRGDKLLMIGHPAGLPTKVEDGATVRDPSPSGFFVANTDSYGGNSGSAVFNLQTGEIEGVLVRGEQDYVYTNGCYVSKICSENGCRGEDITKISAVIPNMPASFTK
jgi:V8-like Glu-specific endopeptidase